MSKSDLQQNSTFQKLVQDVQSEFSLSMSQREQNKPQLENQIQQLDKQILGWVTSLSNSELGVETRRLLEENLEQAQSRKKELQQMMTLKEVDSQALASIVDSQQVEERLERLDQVLSQNNPALGNIELSQYIDTITCSSDGRTVIRTCRLGPLKGAVPLFSSDENKRLNKTQPNSAGTATPRRRVKRKIDHINAGIEGIDELNEWATNPDRFAGLDEVWFDEQEFYPPEKVHPYQEIAPAVAQKRKDGLTHEKLAEYFGVTTPTIRKALSYAAKTDPTLRDFPRMAPQYRWHEDYAERVMAMKHTGKSTKEMAIHFGKSTSTILNAINYWKSQQEDPEF